MTKDDEPTPGPWRFTVPGGQSSTDGDDALPWTRPAPPRRPPSQPTVAPEPTGPSAPMTPSGPYPASSAPSTAGSTLPPTSRPNYGGTPGYSGPSPNPAASPYPGVGPSPYPGPTASPHRGSTPYPVAPGYPPAPGYPGPAFAEGSAFSPTAGHPSPAFPATYPATTYPGGTNYPGPTYPGTNYPGTNYPGGTYPGGTYPGGTYPGGTYPGTNYPGGYGGGGWGWEPPGPPGPYGPPSATWGPPPRNRKGVLGLIVLVSVLVAALVGLAIGSAIKTQHDLAQQQQAANGGVASGAGGLPSAQAESIAAGVEHSVVDVNARLGYAEAAAAGTGMVLTSDGEVLTNNHVVAGETSLSVTVVGGRTYSARVLGTDPSMDVALLKLDNASGLTPITVGDASKLSSGQPIVAVGNAGGVGGTPSVVTGTIAALGQSVTASDLGGGNAENLTDMIEINAPLEPGDSGGPLVDTSGQAVGMDTAAATDGEFTPTSVGFSIPINRAVAIAQQIAAGHGSSTVLLGLPGFLGVQVASANPGSVPGAPVSGVLPDSPADKAGLTAGDVITAIDGKTIDSPNALTATLEQHHGGDKVIVGWVDSFGSRHKATITLIPGPAA